MAWRTTAPKNRSRSNNPIDFLQEIRYSAAMSRSIASVVHRMLRPNRKDICRKS